LKADLLEAKPAKWIGMGFNIYGAYDLMSSVKPISILDARKADTEETEIGEIPDYCDYLEDPKVYYFEASGETRESFQRKFSSRANVDLTVGAFSGHMSAYFSETSSAATRYFYACRAYMNQMGAIAQTRFDEQYLSDQFLKRVAALPSKYADSNLS